MEVQDVTGIFEINVKFTRFSNEASRLRSFEEWPKSMEQKPEVLSEAGFFYTKVSDRVACFNCGLGLRCWEREDDPWEQHIKYSPNCTYVHMVKGRAFIHEIIGKLRTKAEQNGEEMGEIATPESNNAEDEAEQVVDEYCDKCEEKMRERRQCKICCVEEKNTVFIPCGHAIACVKCAFALTECPTCQKAFKSIVRVYFA